MSAMVRTFYPLSPLHFAGMLTGTAGLFIITPSLSAAITPFSEVSASVGVSEETNSFWGSGIAFLDHDGDGDLDLYVVDGEGDPNVFFRNNGNRTFTEIAGTIGLGNSNWGKAVVPADIDNDGDQDMLLTTYGAGESNRLFRNDGGVFTDITAGSGFDFNAICTGAAWGDYDMDGLLDCHITVYEGNHRDRLLHNLGGGVFQDVAAALGVQDPTGWGYQSAWLDYDSDGDPDLYVANDDFFGGTANKLYRNNGNGTFTDVSVSSGAGVEMSAMGIAVGDYDNDLDLDIYVTNLPFGNVLLRNNGNGTFTNVAGALGLTVNNICWGADFFDADNDGRLDLYVDVSDENGNPHGLRPTDRSMPQLRGNDGAPNKMFQNNGVSGFSDVSVSSGTNNAGISFCSAVGDYDEDGDLDLYVTNQWQLPGDALSAFYENTHIPRSGSGSDYLRVNLIGTESNRDGVGAQVWIKTSAGWQLRERQAGTGYLSSSEPTLHFGLGAATTVSVLYVRWPSGLIESYQNIPAGQTLTLVEGDGSVTSVEDLHAAQTRWSIAPNPMSRGTEIRLSHATANARIDILDVQGRLRRSLHVPSLAGTDHVVLWDGTDDSGKRLPSGSYFVKLGAPGSSTQGSRIVLLDQE